MRSRERSGSARPDGVVGLGWIGDWGLERARRLGALIEFCVTQPPAKGNRAIGTIGLGTRERGGRRRRLPLRQLQHEVRCSSAGRRALALERSCDVVAVVNGVTDPVS